jgi:predicted restriction endonuclease
MRLTCFGDKGTDIPSTKSLRLKVRTAYDQKCLLCGTTEDLHVAHLVSHNSTMDYSRFQRPIYKTSFDPSSIRNRILLCGTKGVRGSCHDLFDNFKITIVYDALSSLYRALVVMEDTNRPSFKVSQNWELTFPPNMKEEYMPYKRLLAWRTRKCAMASAPFLSPDVLTSLVTTADLSEADEVGNAGEESSEGSTTEKSAHY